MNSTAAATDSRRLNCGGRTRLSGRVRGFADTRRVRHLASTPHPPPAHPRQLALSDDARTGGVASAGPPAQLAACRLPAAPRGVR